MELEWFLAVAVGVAVALAVALTVVVAFGLIGFSPHIDIY